MLTKKKIIIFSALIVILVSASLFFYYYKKDVRDCQKITDKNSRHWCLFDVAKNKKNIKICELLAEPDYCYSALAEIMKSQSVCDKINDAEFKNTCVANSNPACVLKEQSVNLLDESFDCNNNKLKSKCISDPNCGWDRYYQNNSSSICTCCPNNTKHLPGRCLPMGD
ncbi:MAG: hypothetical protein WC745_00055 [Patescibacteria group bacterium]|jgi:hypothetical protein